MVLKLVILLQCAKVGMEDLTFTRYILELSLMEYSLIDCSDSALAAAALLLSRCIKGHQPLWGPTLEYYSGKVLTVASLSLLSITSYI